MEYRFDADATTHVVDDLAKTADGALTYVRANKTGKRPDERLVALLEAARIMWTFALGRPFQLDWTDNREPVEDAARFCFDVARTADATSGPNRTLAAT